MYFVIALVICGCLIETEANLFSFFNRLFQSSDNENEICSDYWINNDIAGLSEKLDTKLFGQHLVKKPLIQFLSNHVNSDPKKALVLSFHGSTGTGKNYVSQMIADFLYKKGANSKFVHLFTSYKYRKAVAGHELYKDELQKDIVNAVTLCDRSLFIFDEIDKMPDGIIDVIIPFVKSHKHLDGVVYRKSIFIFLSNIGQQDIYNRSVSHFNKGLLRESITLGDMEDAMRNPAYNVPNGFKHSDLISDDFISVFIPFLPLERKHIRQCIKEEFGNETVGEDIMQRIIKEMRFDQQGLYSVTGCKRVPDKIVLIKTEL